MTLEKIKVWDPFVRLFHWTIVILFFCNYLLSDRGMPFARGDTLHRYTGYVVIGFVLARCIWGFIGTRHARFKSFIPKRSEFIDYMKAMLRGEHPYYEGHNPAGAVMILFLLAGLLATGITGWLTVIGNEYEGWQASVAAATDFIYWGDVHEIFANLTMLAAGIHITAVVLVSHLTHENLIHSMITGYKKKVK